jgi:hypothetical protein
MYAVIGLTPVLTYVVGAGNSQVTDAAGVAWQTRSIAETGATVSIYTMLFAVALSLVRLVQGAQGAALEAPGRMATGERSASGTSAR